MSASLLKCHDYSHYARRMLDAGRFSDEQITALKNRLPLSVVEITALFGEYTPDHHDAEYAAGVAMRQVRILLMLALMEYDLTNPPTDATLAVVTQSISALADAAVLHALAVCYRALVEIHGEPRSETTGESMPLWVMGMGKLSGHELNVSSDVDLVFVFEHDGETVTSASAPPNVRIRHLSHSDFFDRLGKRIIKLLDDVNEFGFVFRVDMRLRPNGASGALCVSLGTLEKYLFTQARTWERFVWLKSRLINPSAASHFLTEMVQPFVFRRYLDYDAIDSLRDVYGKIRAKAEARTAKNRDCVDIKIGSGGIREIEFSVQLPQIIKGARLPKLQTQATLAALPELAKAGLMPPETAQQLHTHYVFLRHLEHRIQYLDDAQTQQMPTNTEQRERLATAMGCADAAKLNQRLHQVQSEVSAYFNTLFTNVPPPTITTADATQNDDEASLWARFDAPQTAQEIFAQTLTNPKLSLLPERSLARYKQLVRGTAQTLVRLHPTTPIPTEWLQRVWHFLDAVSRRSSYLALLTEYPKATERLVEMLTRSRWAADYLTAHPILLDELLNIEQLHRTPDWSALAAQLNDHLQHAASDVERQMDILRETHHAHVFRLLAQELDGLWTVEQLADHMSDLTDVLLQAALNHCWQAFNKKHRNQPKFALIAYGKLGGKEMGYASDLDLVFIYDDEGGRDQEAPMVYGRFAQRLDNWLTAATGAGVLFETDYRLRPNGDSGLLVVSTKMFEQYQTQSAWFWEHQALTRARYCAGDTKVGAWFEQSRRRVLAQPREPQTVRDEITAMRNKLQAGHPNPSELFDLKYDTGGMVDIEFCVQALILMHAVQSPELLDNKGNIALLERAEHAGLISSGLGSRCADAYREYRRQQHQARLQNEKARVERSTVTEWIDAVNRLREEVLGK